MPKAVKKPAAKTKATPKAAKEEPKMIDHVVTEEDLAANIELVEQGVEVGQTIQVPADSIVEEESKESEEETEEETEEDEEEISEGEASVYKENGEFVRAYSKAVHGKDFKKLAKEFAGKIGGLIK